MHLEEYNVKAGKFSKKNIGIFQILYLTILNYYKYFLISKFLNNNVQSNVYKKFF